MARIIASGRRLSSWMGVGLSLGRCRHGAHSGVLLKQRPRRWFGRVFLGHFLTHFQRVTGPVGQITRYHRRQERRYAIYEHNILPCVYRHGYDQPG
jgi:hypothetical protein